ncbi:MAG: phospho-N-acetylmuramoyl-pentapeptide-transferase [Firmicutes bacterium]|nr:phospho-N-acetylmuramoyl-pentapeptide-transferase [Bacillota bacterium]
MQILIENIKGSCPYLAFLAASFALCALAMAALLPVLRRLKAGQSIREDGPQAHLAKAGTPTMGGIAMIAAVTACVIAGILIKPSYGGGPVISSVSSMLSMLFVMLAYGAIGFFDDYIKVTKKHNEGLTAKQKLALQILAAAVFAVWNGGAHYMVVPFLGTFRVGKVFGILFEVFVMVAMTNGVNLTDGLDGLAASVTAVAAAFFMLLAPRLVLSETGVFAACISGACLGFLLYNRHPAKVFMGDTGSLALGGGLAALAAVSCVEWALPIAGGIYVAEALSVIIQVFVFKTQNGRRFFRMAPLHHHFELGGWDEVKVVRVFTLVTAALCVIAYIGIMAALRRAA